MTAFEVLQFVHEHIELLVRDGRLVEHVVIMIVLMQLLSEIYDAFCFVHNRNDIWYIFLKLKGCLSSFGHDIEDYGCSDHWCHGVYGEHCA